MNILCSCDNNYAPYCGIMLTSLFENNRESEVVVYILTNKVSDENIGRFHKLAESYSQTIRFIEVSDEMTKDFPLWQGDHFSLVAYYRLLITNILPTDVEKILYLDCDIIVNRSVAEYYETDLTNMSAGAIIDNDFDCQGRNKALGMKGGNIYFNSGVLLINLRYWREHNIQEQFIKFIESHKDVLHTHDQDVLNGVLQGTVEYLPVGCNYQTLFLIQHYLSRYDEKFRNDILSYDESNIPIIHYSTPVKPWNCWHFAYPFDNVWQRYKKRSLWADAKYKQPWRQRINCWMVKTLCRLGVKKIEI